MKEFTREQFAEEVKIGVSAFSELTVTGDAVLNGTVSAVSLDRVEVKGNLCFKPGKDGQVRYDDIRLRSSVVKGKVEPVVLTAKSWSLYGSMCIFTSTLECSLNQTVLAEHLK